MAQHTLWIDMSAKLFTNAIIATLIATPLAGPQPVAGRYTCKGTGTKTVTIGTLAPPCCCLLYSWPIVGQDIH
jgi:hypothetical protein